MRVSVLGATEAWRGEERLLLGSRKRRALVAALALSGGRPVSVDALVDLLWGDAPPDGVAGTLQVYVSGLRRVIEPERAPRAPATVLVTVEPGYALVLPDDGLDAARFDRAVSGAHRLLASAGSQGPEGVAWVPTGLAAADLRGAMASLDEALGLWRGTPYVELEEAPAAVAERARLEELRTVALEDRAVAALALGDHATVAAELEALTARYPLRERLWGLRALALARAGRQADALEALAAVRTVLDEELGLEPGTDLRSLQTAVLRQDPALAWAPPPGADVVEVSTAPAADPHPAPDPQAVTAAPARRPAVVPGVTLPPWPLVGRDRQLLLLIEAWTRAETGVPAFAALTGEPGIGKSRLSAELAGHVVTRGARVLVGRCSQDGGAPALWPWQQVLEQLGEQLEEGGEEDEGSEFRVREGLARRVADAAAAEPVLLVLEDLHWADVASLRVLRMLVDTVASGRLLVLATWRSHPEPTGALADVAESLARRHAERLELTGLGLADVAAVVGSVASVVPDDEQSRRLAERTDGNPFFLVEYARLARDGDLTALLADPDPPTAVTDVVSRRLARLPDDTRALLRWAAVLGRRFTLVDLAAVADLREDDVLDRLDPAVDAGLVREVGADGFSFAHALVRDTVTAATSPARLARAHARTAEVLETRTGRESEVARHWQAAGPAYSGRAWRAAAAAGGVARRRHASDAAVALFTAALDAVALDPEATPLDRYGLLMELAEVYRWTGNWLNLIEVVEAAIGVADELGDIRLLAEAGCGLVRGALWQSPRHGGEHVVVVDALRRALAGLPEEDSELRCRVLLAMSTELYYRVTPDERQALADAGLEMARRLGDPELLVHACEVWAVGTWRPATAPARVEVAEEGVRLARELGHERSYVACLSLLAIALGELGQRARQAEVMALAFPEARRLHLPYALLVLESMEIPWLAMEGRFDEVEASLARIIEVTSGMRLPQAEDGVLGAVGAQLLWSDRAGELAELLKDTVDGPLPTTALHAAIWSRIDRVDEARAVIEARGAIDLSADSWFSMLVWAPACEAAAGLGDRDLAARAYERLTPYAGYAVTGGSGLCIGPVQAFLALAAATVGETELAARHADRAEEMCAEWGIPLCAQWLQEQRQRYGF
ncbi:BTAD domain-containing putative transcriptional regulator [Nocardioides taihuensis]|uniref:BTAD domain-containing putative transcriptional regulator n=1 Tax=Nocardioides taihuensis TaxID=1835606 RepID=A0ABW0BGP3_9ACTN